MSLNGERPVNEGWRWDGGLTSLLKVHARTAENPRLVELLGLAGRPRTSSTGRGPGRERSEQPATLKPGWQTDSTSRQLTLLIAGSLRLLIHFASRAIRSIFAFSPDQKWRVSGVLGFEEIDADLQVRGSDPPIDRTDTGRDFEQAGVAARGSGSAPAGEEK